MAYKAKNDLIGKVLGRLTVLRRVGANRHGQSLWLCRCECGREVEVIRQNLLTGHSQSCGHHTLPPTVHLKAQVESLLQSMEDIANIRANSNSDPEIMGDALAEINEIARAAIAKAKGAA